MLYKIQRSYLDNIENIVGCIYSFYFVRPIITNECLLYDNAFLYPLAANEQ